jgi:hypothetical protein
MYLISLTKPSTFCSIGMIVNKLIEQGNVDDAVKLLKNTEETGTKARSTFASSK